MNMNDRDTVEKLIADNRGLIYAQFKAQKWTPEAESAAYEALWIAAATYDPFKNTKFATYAVNLIRNAIRETYRTRYYQESQIPSVPIPEQLMDTLDIAEYNIKQEAVLLVSKYINKYIESKTLLEKQIVMEWYNCYGDILRGDIALKLGCSVSYVHKTLAALICYLAENLPYHVKLLR